MTIMQALIFGAVAAGTIFQRDMPDGIITFDDFSKTVTSGPTYSTPPTQLTGGLVQSGTGALTVPLPSGASGGDLAIIFIETANQNSVPGLAGWTTIANPGTGTGGGTAATRMGVFRKILDAGDIITGSVAVSDSGNHQIAQMVTFSGHDPVDPIGAVDSDVAATASTSVTCPAITTTRNNSMVVHCVARALPDGATAPGFRTWANASLSSFAQQTDVNTAAGNGGGFTMARGILVTAGGSGTGTCTLGTSTVQARVTFAINPAAD